MRSNPAHRTTALHVACSLTVVALVAGCGAQPRVTAQQESSSYLSRAGRSYTPPGPASDPWGPYVSEASTRFDVPQRWIREVMRQESGGRLYGRNGQLVTSGAGAMGLMQVMPGTYDELRSRYPDLGDDPYDPHNNILAGTAYLQEMHARFGAPAFLAAYNAGPDRVEAYLAGGTMLPDETVNYVAAIGPRIGMPGSFGPGGFGQPFFAAPALNDDRRGQVRPQDFVPADHRFAVLLEQGQHPAVEIGLQLMLVHGLVIRLHHSMLARVGRDAWVAPPLPPVVLIATHVEIWVWKQRGHFRKQRIEE